jgi:glycosyltransferase involved in cell wall biosynthesis
MKVLHFILGTGQKDRASGVNQVIAGLCKYLVKHGVTLRVIGKARSAKADGQLVQRDGFDVEVYSRWNRALLKALDEAVSWADIVHLHGVYSPANLVISTICNRHRTPYIVTPHNGLSPELAANRGRVRKWIFHATLQHAHLRGAIAIHHLTEEEGTDILCATTPLQMFCIPNGVDLDDFPAPNIAPATTEDRLRVGYLGRLSSEKNIESLGKAVRDLTTSSFRPQLTLCGPMSDYGRSIREKCGLNDIELIPPVYGSAKRSFFESIDMFVLPSISEGFPIVAAECLASGTPLLVTRTSKLSYFLDHDAFFMCEPTQYGIAKGISAALSRRAEWPAIALRGRKLVDARLNWSVIAHEMLCQYSRVLRDIAK